VVGLAMSKKFVDEAIQERVNALRQQGMIEDPQQVEEVRASMLRITYLLSGVLIAIGVLFIIFGIAIYTKPVPITITSLVIYIGCMAIFGFLDPASLAQGIIVKIIIIAGLVKAVQAAIAYEKERSARTDKISAGVEPAGFGGLEP
jgi:predicted RND superfamily exporter protein